jgi:type II pantothenate kinase
MQQAAVMATAHGTSSTVDSMRSKLASGLSVDALEETISNPGTVRINVEGAFIVEGEAASPENHAEESNGVRYEHKDIRLPHHTSVVSHVAVDVSVISPLLGPALLFSPPNGFSASFPLFLFLTYFQ